jgi:hypothetical protein
VPGFIKIASPFARSQMETPRAGGRTTNHQGADSGEKIGNLEGQLGRGIEDRDLTTKDTKDTKNTDEPKCFR